MGFFDDPYEVNGVHYRSWETYERARKRSEAAGKRAEAETLARNRRRMEAEARRDIKAQADAERRVRRAMEARERTLRDLGVEEQRTRREELRLERARMQEEAADRRAAEAAERAAEEAGRALALERLGERMEAEAEAWSYPAALAALDPRSEADPEAAAEALAGPRPVEPPTVPPYVPLPLDGVTDGPLPFLGIERPQAWWPSLLPEEALRSEEDMAAERDALARGELEAAGIGGERHPLPGRRRAWQDAYAIAYSGASVADTAPLPGNAAANAATRELLARCVALTIGEVRQSVAAAAREARHRADGMRLEAGGRRAEHAVAERRHEEAAAAYAAAAGPWEEARAGWSSRLGELAAGYAGGTSLEAWLAAAAARSIDPYVPGTPEVAAAVDGCRGTIDVVIPPLEPPPGGVRPLPDGHLEAVPLPRERARELAGRAARHLVVRILVEAFRKDPLGHLSEITVNAWSTGVPVGTERRGVGFLSSATAGRDLALAYNGDAEAFLRAAGTAEPVRTTVCDGTLTPAEPLPIWAREEP